MSQTRRYQAGELIHQRGERKPGLSIVVTGAVSVGNYGMDGRYIQTTLLGPGESFGEFTLFSQLPRTHTAEAVGLSEVDHIPPPVLKRALEQNPQLALGLLASLSTRLHRMLEAVDDIKRLPLPVRLAKLLLMLAHQDSGRYWVGYSQEQLAERLGMTRVSIATALKALEQDNLISRHYQRVEIIEPALMQQWLQLQTQTLPL